MLTAVQQLQPPENSRLPKLVSFFFWQKNNDAVSNLTAKNMEKKTKRTLLGIQKNNKKSTKRNKQTLLKNVVDYLRADSYLFGVKIKEPIRGTKKKFIGKVMEYLKSDDYMYASLVYGPLTISVQTAPDCKVGMHGGGPPMSRGPTLSNGESKLHYIRSFSMDISTRKLTTGENQPTMQSANMIAKNQPFKDSFGRISDPPSNRTSGIGETVKHMVYQNRRSSSV